LTKRLPLQCTPTRLTYDYVRRYGQLVVMEGHCVDMLGCIALFQHIDPQVQLIDTFSYDVPDTRYTLVRPGMWLADSPSPE